MKTIYKRPSGIKEGVVSGFCPGCTHTLATKLICEVLDELGAAPNTVSVQGIGCAGLLMPYLTYDFIIAPHGRACALASAYKRCNPDTVVWTYQGDGDLAAIGLGETISAANRGENFTVIFINNAVYGMTGGQMAPTTMVGMKTTTSPNGRDPGEHGYPMHMCELLNQLEAPSYLARVSCTDVPHTRKAKKAIKKAFQNQLDGKGFSFVEILSTCPTNWGLSPLDSLKFVADKMEKEFPLGEFRAR